MSLKTLYLRLLKAEAALLVSSYLSSRLLLWYIGRTHTAQLDPVVLVVPLLVLPVVTIAYVVVLFLLPPQMLSVLVDTREFEAYRSQALFNLAVWIYVSLLSVLMVAIPGLDLLGPVMWAFFYALSRVVCTVRSILSAARLSV